MGGGRVNDYLTIEEVKVMFGCIAELVIENESWLTQIDSQIGDGDHGIGMTIGFKAVQKQLPRLYVASVNELFKEVGMVLLDTMGGASGVIFGTMFISGYGAAPPKKYLDLDTLGKMFERSLKLIKSRGKAKPGDKTMIDSFEPAVIQLVKSAQTGASLCEGMSCAAKAAKGGMEASKMLQAEKGRASSYGMQSVGLPDPGAVSVSLIFQAMDSFLKSRRESIDENDI